MRGYLQTGILVAAVTLGWTAETVAAPDDERWTPWIGCWNLWNEPHAGPGAAATDAARIAGTAVCVAPAPEGVTVTASVDEEILSERQLIADGIQRPVSDAGCEGWARSEWSHDGRRVFSESSITCGGEPTRHVAGLSFLSSTARWVDVRLVDLSGVRQQIEVRRYTAMPFSETADRPGAPPPSATDPEEVQQARRAVADDLAVHDVVDASERTDPRVVEALLTEIKPDLDLMAADVLALDDAGIDHDVIDLLVAQSYPERFVVERRHRSGGWSSGTGWGFGGFGRYYDPIWYGDLYPYYVTPFGYPYWGTYPYLGATPFVVLDSGRDKAAPGRAYRGGGYTRVRPRTAGTAGHRVAVPRTGGRSETPRRIAPASGGSTGGPAVTRGGYRTGGGSGSTSGGGRRAVPR